MLSLTGLLNVALNLFFVLVCDLSVEGVALATFILALTALKKLKVDVEKESASADITFITNSLHKDLP